MDRTATFNNAGVRFLEAGLSEVGLRMFQAALEESLILAKPGGEEEARLATAQANVARAETHLNNMESLLSEAAQRRSLASSATSADGGSVNADESEVVSSEQRQRPYLYRYPILLDSDGENTSLQLTGAIVIFNLALVLHMKSRSSQKAKSFYKIAEALIQCEEEGRELCGMNNDSAPRFMLLQVAVTNNHGVWLYENGHVNEARDRCDRLRVIHGTFGLSCLPPQVREGVQSNLRRRATAAAAPLFAKSLPVA